MAKSSYNIPVSINRSMLDHELVLTGGGMHTKPLPLKVILYWVGIFFLITFMVMQGPGISNSPLWLRFIFIVWAIGTAAFFGRYTKTKEMKFRELPALISYLPRSGRKIMTRKSSEPYGFMNLVGIKEIEPGGIIHYLDGTVGRAYAVVGSASVLLFDGDRSAIVNRVDAFFRKADTDSEWSFVTMKEPQRVYRQIANVERRNQALLPQNRHPELRELLEEQYEILRDDVGGKFDALHQYLVIRSKNLTALDNAHTLLAAEVGASSMMFKQCTVLDDKSTLQFLRSVYGPRTTGLAGDNR